MEMDADMDGAAMDQAQYAYPPPEDGRKQLYVVFRAFYTRLHI